MTWPWPPLLRRTEFPDAQVAAAIAELERVATRLDGAATDRATASAPALASWEGPCAEATAHDHEAGQRAAADLAAALRSAASRLRDAQVEADRLRRIRRDAHDRALADWRTRILEAS